MRLVIEDIGIGPRGFRERSGVYFSLDTGTTMGPTAGRNNLIGDHACKADILAVR